MPVPHHSVFTGRMPFLPPNQQHQSTEGIKTDDTSRENYLILSSSTTRLLRDRAPLFLCWISHHTYWHWLPLLLLHPFNGLSSRTTWVSRHQKGKPFWILLQQEMMGWQWHQLDDMQIICTSFQTDHHASTPALSFLQAGCPSCHPTNSVKALKAIYWQWLVISKCMKELSTICKSLQNLESYIFAENLLHVPL